MRVFLIVIAFFFFFLNCYFIYLFNFLQHDSFLLFYVGAADDHENAFLWD